MLRLLLTLLVCLPGSGQVVRGVVTDGRAPLEGVRVYADRTRRVDPHLFVPLARTGPEGTFFLPQGKEDTVLVMEKEGHVMDLVPVAALDRPVVLPPHTRFRRDRVLLVRVDFEGMPSGRSEEALKQDLFGRRPGEASAASYLYEASKGGLLLEPGVTLTLRMPGLARPIPEDRDRIVTWVLDQLKVRDLRTVDWVDNATGEPGADGKPDHLWVVVPGPCSAATGKETHFPARSTLYPLTWKPGHRWPVVFFTEETPVGTLVHELLHAQGEHRVDDYYVEGRAGTAGTWDPMDAGQLLGWDAPGAEGGAWRQGMAYSPSLPMAWTLRDLWYRGWWKDTVLVQWVRGATWEGWLAPLARAPGQEVQALRVADPSRPGCFWELSVRRPWGFDRGRVGGRFGPGHEGLVVAAIDPSRLSSDGDSKGPVRVVDARPRTPEPDRPRHPGGRWQLDDAAFGVGKGEMTSGRDGALRWKVLAADGLGRLKVRVDLAKAR